MTKKLCQRFIVLFGLIFLLACSVLVLPDSQAAAKLDECEDCYAKCNADYAECINMGIERPWKCSQYRMNCFNFCNAEYCNP
ncbi:MAG TPA: hypothetical protein VF599_16535 [Pyrinomonadaceae bacterium]|jgi:hypothetical protein